MKYFRGDIVKIALFALQCKVSILEKIAGEKRERLARAKRVIPLHELNARIKDSEKPRDFRAAIRRAEGRVRLIAEIKKASPAKGIIREDFDPEQIARVYEERKVSAVSVITEEEFFLGNLDFLPLVKETVTRPVLRKDFIIDEYQLYESRAEGADAVLLIGALVGKTQSEEFLHIARELGMAVLYEVHDPYELEKALKVNSEIIGINNRDLSTFTVDLETTLTLKREIPPGRIVVSESGIGERRDVQLLENAGVDAILVGTSLMRAPDISRKIQELWGS